MTHSYLLIEWPQMALSVLFLGVAAVLSLRYRLGLHKDLLIGGVRCFAQLIAMGYVLHLVFGTRSALVVLGLMALMGFFATRIVGSRVHEPRVSTFLPVLCALQGTYFLMAFVVSAFIIQARPWWEPQYLIPVGGMLAGNAMNTIALALDRFFADLRSRRDEVELRLVMGATPTEASEDMFREALRSGMIPSINSLMGVGIVSLPGMMTGQIMAGANPIDAVRYQVVVMLMLVATTALSSFLALSWVRKRCFTEGYSPIVRP